MATENYGIITCDGGGIRGLVTAMLIEDLVSGDPNLLGNVSLFAGTSTGGIIAIGLASGVPPSKLVHLYKRKCSEIFQPYNPSLTASLPELPHLSSKLSLDICADLPGLCYVKYTNEGLKNLLASMLGNRTLADLLPTSALVTTFAMSDSNGDPWGPLALSNLPNSQFGSTALVDAAMSTGAAPIYFPPHELPGNPTRWCADGGLFANNPSAFALANVLASGVLQSQNKTIANVRLLSIGTGQTVDTVSFDLISIDPFAWGALAWLFPFSVPPHQPSLPLLTALFDGQAQLADVETSLLLTRDQYRRANVTLTETASLDDCGSIEMLKSATNAYIQSDDWKQKKEWAYQNFV